MLITYYIVFYQFLNRILTKPWTFDNQKKETLQRRLFLRTLASILFHFFNDYFKKNVTQLENTMHHLSLENRIETRTPKYLFFDDRMAQEGEYPDKEDIFGDLFTKVQLKMVFLDKVAKFEQINMLVQTFLKKITNILQNSHRVEEALNESKRKFQLYKQKILTIKFLN